MYCDPHLSARRRSVPKPVFLKLFHGLIIIRQEELELETLPQH